MPKKKPFAFDPDSLGVQRTAMKRQRRGPAQPMGKRSNLPFNEFLYRLFIANEKFPKSKKMTDQEIERQVKLEFPHFKQVNEKVKKHGIPFFRNEFNRGKLNTKAAPPWFISTPYDDNGNKINPSRFTSIMSKADVKKHEDKYRKNYREPWMKDRGLTEAEMDDNIKLGTG